MIQRAALALYRLGAYLAFQASFLALILASTGLGSVLSVDKHPRLPPLAAFAVDVGLVLLFGVQHSVMARPWFKRLVPERIERSTFVIASSACASAMALAWSPIEGDLWHLGGPAAVAVQGVALLGFGLSAVSSFAFDHFELFGLRGARSGQFRVPAMYRIVRHPMMLGILIGVWAAPHMTLGHLIFAAALTAYILVGVRYEERDLVRTFGQEYQRYRAAVPCLLPWPRPTNALRERALE